MRSDKYASLTALRQFEKPEDYRVRLLDRASPLTVIAPHGGFIDAGTSGIASAIAGREYNLYDFQGLRREDSFELHVTSTRFSDPPLTRLLERSTAAVAVHGMGDTGEETIWLGGLNRPLKAAMYRRLVSAGFDVNDDSPAYRGESPRNVVNRVKNHGVQFELPRGLIRQLYRDELFLTNGRTPSVTPRFRSLVRAIRAEMRRHLHHQALSKSA
jgi:phage replication-related protein YjqB (UPF0714/DUF867 family)